MKVNSKISLLEREKEVLRLIELFKENNLKFIVIGGYAVSTYKKRFSIDLDLVVKEEALEDGKQTWERQDTVWDDLLQIIRNYRKPNCPQCKKGRLRFAGIVPRNNCGPG